ncbi:MAG: hypothetical protein LBT14_05050 [Treponema sp.]|jgi:hypothetical protein|nr:hypothetical protein [Treponema sp.]
MTTEKTSSLENDHVTSGSSNELDAYGVWVKSEPQILSSVDDETGEFSVPAMLDTEELPDLDLEMGTGSHDDFSLKDHVLGDSLSDIATDGNPQVEADDHDEGVSSFDALVEPEDTAEPEDSFASLGVSNLSDDQEEPFDLDELLINESRDDIFSIDAVPDNELPLDKISVDEAPINEAADDASLVDESSDHAVPLDAVSIDEAPEEVPVEAVSGESPAEVVSAPEEPDAVAMDHEAIDEPELESKQVDREPAPPQLPSPDVLSQLVMRVVEELSLIRTELSGIKEEFKSLRREVPAPAVDAQGKAENHGFFDEEEDEKIALTGDELDNIINTTDFIEETGEEPTMDADAEGVDENSDAIALTGDELDNILNTSDIIEENAVEGVSVFESVDDDAVPDLDLSRLEQDGSTAETAGEVSFVPADGEFINFDDSEELQQLRAEGVKPYTEAPDDIATNYLKADPFAKQHFDETSIDLSDAVIDEPDLSDIEEAPLEEPAIEDIAIDDINIDAIGSGDEIDAEEEEETDFPMLTGIETEASPAPDATEASAKNTKVLSDDVMNEVLAQAGLTNLFGFTFTSEDGDTGEKAGDAVDTNKIDVLDAKVDDTPVAPPLVPPHVKQDLKTVLSYMDKLLESLPEEKITEFAGSEYFDTYKALFTELGLV